MIYSVSGKLMELSPTFAVVECGGLGYLIHISLTTYAHISGAQEVKLYIHPIYKEDAQTLYGFYDRQEREIFGQLISVSGVGGNTARVILSSLSPAEVIEAIAGGNDALLKSIKGIGAKTAQRIIVDLRDKIGSSAAGSAGVPGGGGLRAEAVSALEVLGYPARASEKVVNQVLRQSPTASLELIIKEALKSL